MLYLIVFGLDFYSNLLILLKILTVLSIITLIIAIPLYVYNSNTKYVEKYKIDPNNKDNNYYGGSEIRNYKISISILKKKTLMVSIIILTVLAPSDKTLYMALGIYTGQTVIEKVQNSPLATKAYTLLEQKINEMLDEQVKEVKPTEKGK